MITKKTYRVIAETIRGLPKEIKAEVAYKFAKTLGEHDLDFDLDKFMLGCGIAIPKEAK
jgi:hypothetical protein